MNTINGFKSLVAYEDDKYVVAAMKDSENPFFSMKKSNNALDFQLQYFTSTVLDFAQFLITLGNTLTTQDNLMDSIELLVPLKKETKIDINSGEKPVKDDVRAEILTDGSIRFVQSDVTNDEISLEVVKWLMQMFAQSENTDPILGIVGLTRMVEGKWDYSNIGHQQTASNAG